MIDFLISNKVLRYIFSGGIATLSNLFFLFIFADIFDIWYLFSSIVAFVLSVIVSFSLHKYWTFNNKGNDVFLNQFYLFFLIVLINLLLNTVLIAFMVEYFGIYHIIAQLIVSAIIGLISFFEYGIIFRNDS